MSSNTQGGSLVDQARGDRILGDNILPTSVQSTWFESLKAFIGVNVKTRLRDQSFIAIYIMAPLFAMIYLQMDSNSLTSIKAAPAPTVIPYFNGTHVMNLSLLLGACKHLGLSPSSELIYNLSNSSYFNQYFEYFSTKELMAENFSNHLESAVGVHVTKLGQDGQTSVTAFSSQFADSITPINFASELAYLYENTTLKSFNFSSTGFSHPAMNSKIEGGALSALYVYVFFVLVGIRSIQLFFKLGKERVLFMCKLNRLPDSVLYIGTCIVGFIELLPSTIVCILWLSFLTPSTKGSNVLLVSLFMILFLINFWVYLFALGSTLKTDGAFGLFSFLLLIFGMGVALAFVIPSYLGSYIKILMVIFPNSAIHALMFLLSKIMAFYGSVGFSHLQAVFYFSLADVLLCQVLSIVLWSLILLIFVMCADRFFGLAPIGWSNFFNFKKWSRILFGNNPNQVSLAGENAFGFNQLMKTYHGEEGDVVALNDVSESIKQGEVIILIGPNGSGKSTLINCMTGAVAFDEGNLSLYNSDLTDDFSQLYTVLGFVAQDNVIFEFLTVREHLEFFGKLRGIPDEMLTSDIEFFADSLHLKNQLDSRAQGLSGGEKRKLCIAISLIQRPKILILDEPTSGVDVQSRSIIWKTIGAFKGTTSFISTHALEEAESVCSRIFVMKEGKITFSGSPAELRVQTKCGYVLNLMGKKSEQILGFIRGIIPEAIEEEDRDGYQFPADMRVVSLLEELETHKKELDIDNYSIHLESLEENLIRFVQEAEHD